MTILPIPVKEIHCIYKGNIFAVHQVAAQKKHGYCHAP